MINFETVYISDLFISENENHRQVYLTKNDFNSEIYYKQSVTEAYYVEIGRSYEIEFNLGGFYPNSDKILHRARLYCISKYYGEVFEFFKSEEYIDFIKKLFNGFMKIFLEKSTIINPYEISKNAFNWAKEKNAELSTTGIFLVAK